MEHMRRQAFGRDGEGGASHVHPDATRPFRLLGRTLAANKRRLSALEGLPASARPRWSGAWHASAPVLPSRMKCRGPSLPNVFNRSRVGFAGTESVAQTKAVQCGQCRRPGSQGSQEVSTREYKQPWKHRTFADDA